MNLSINRDREEGCHHTSKTPSCLHTPGFKPAQYRSRGSLAPINRWPDFSHDFDVMVQQRLGPDCDPSICAKTTISLLVVTRNFSELHNPPHSLYTDAEQFMLRLVDTGVLIQSNGYLATMHQHAMSDA